MKKVYEFLVDGFEEIEAVTPVDFLRRADVEVYMVGITGKQVTGAHNMVLTADIDATQAFDLPLDADMIILPGGPGVGNLQKSSIVQAAVQEALNRGIYIAAICAAPTVLDAFGAINGKTVTCFPLVQENITKATYTGSALEIDGNIITARSAGVALKFAYALANLMAGKEKADFVYDDLYPEK